MAFTIDNLEIQIDTNAKKAEGGLDSLAASLAKLKTAVGDTSGLATNLKDIATALHTFSAVGKVRMTVPINQLKKLESVIPTLSSPQATQMADNLTKIAYAIEKFSATSGVGAQMKDAAKGMNALAKSTNSFEKATKTANGAHKGTLYTLSSYVNQYRKLYRVIDEVVDVCADLFNESNEYVEALNLFKVTMGDASDAALEYAESLRDAMGIDPAEWITNQGTFQRMATGFGIASEEAEIMSQNLTQLAYDMASFFNTDVQTAMQKLQSGMSGQIKGLKIWGYNLSVAALQETALNLGIEESVRNMSEAQKAQLRYITLIQRSNGIMGDMAKTINTPANSLRILQAQIELFKRSLGNLVSVIATKVIPYIQAFVELMAEATESWAEAWGFEIKDLPTNNLEMASDVIEGIGDDIDDTTDSVSALKKQLAGFDELNILGDGGADENKDTSYSLGIDLPEYDFLANLDTSTREKIDAIKEDIKELFPLLDTLARAFALAFAAKAIKGAHGALKKFFTTTSAGETIALSAMLAFDKFKDTLKATKNPLKALGSAGKEVWKNFKVAMSSLSPLTKALVSLVAVGIEFDVVKKNVKGLADGSKSLGDALLAIIPTCALVGVAMNAMLPGWGLVATAVVGVTAAIWGWIDAENEARRQFVHDTFYADYGKKVSELGTSFSNLLSASTAAYDGILEKQGSILVAKGNIEKTLDNVDDLVFGVENGAIRIKDAIPTIVSSFETLYNDTKNLLTDTRDLIVGALSGSIGTTLENLGVEIGALSAATGKVTNEALEAIEALNNENADLKKQWEAGEISDDSYFSQTSANIAEIQKWSGVKNEQAEAIESARETFAKAMSDALSGNLTWDDTDAISGVFNGMLESANATKNTIVEAYSELIKAFNMKLDNAKLLGDTESFNMFSEAINALNTAMANDVANVDDMLNTTANALQTDLYKKLGKVFEEANAGYDKKSGWYKAFTTRYEHISDALNDFKKNEFSEMVKLIKETFPDADLWVEEAIESAMGNFYIPDGTTKKVMGSEIDNYVINKDFVSDLDKFVPDTAKMSKETIDGLANSLEGGKTDVFNAGSALGESVEKGYKTSLDIKSPSRVMADRGKDTIQGLVNGLGDQTALSEAIDSIVDKFDILDPIQKLWKNVTNWWKNISLPDVNLLGNIGAKNSGMFNIGQYASGGFPTMGEMFVARENGPELVGRIGNKSAVANNAQIIQGIASAVYNAMMAAQEDGNNGEGGSTRIVVQIGDQAVGEASVRYINGRIVQTGESPIYS